MTVNRTPDIVEVLFIEGHDKLLSGILGINTLGIYGLIFILGCILTSIKVVVVEVDIDVLDVLELVEEVEVEVATVVVETVVEVDWEVELVETLVDVLREVELVLNDVEVD